MMTAAILCFTFFLATGVMLLQNLTVNILATGLVTIILPAVALASACLVPLLSNPMHSLLCLLALFVSTAFLYLVQGAEYLAVVFLIVYVGAVAILFLFVIMLINVKNLISSTKELSLNARVMGATVMLFAFYRLEAALATLTGATPEDSLEYFRQLVATDVLNFSSMYTVH